MKKTIAAFVSGLAGGIGTHLLLKTDLMYARGVSVIGGELFFEIANGILAFYLVYNFFCVMEDIMIRAERKKHRRRVKR
jgi:hypothetical protein